MSRARFFAHSAPDDPTRVWLDADATRHARARRLRVGDRLGAILAPGVEYEAEIVSFTSERTALTLGERLPPSPADPIGDSRLLLALAEPTRLDFAIEKATELGTSGVVLFRARRSQARDLPPARLERLQRVARAACEQCGRTWPPAITCVAGLEQALATLAGTGLVFGFDASGAPWATIAHPAAPSPSGAAGVPQAAVIGPEGGLAGDELDLLRQRGAALISLGPRLLRLETAAVVALGLLATSPTSPAPPPPAGER